MDWNSLVPGCVTADGVATLACLPALFKNIINAALMFAGLTALVFLLYGGFRFMTSGGDPKQAGAARQILTYAIIGLLVVLLSFFIVGFVGYLTNTKDCLTNVTIKGC